MSARENNLLRKEITYRLSYRGTLELDVICRAAIPFVSTLTDDQCTHLKDLLLHKEGDLMSWVVEAQPAPEQYQDVIAWLRTNHQNTLKSHG